MRPVLLRPPFLLSGASKLFSGFDSVICSNVETERCRCPGVTGLSFLIPIALDIFEEVDLFAVGGERDNGLLVG